MLRKLYAFLFCLGVAQLAASGIASAAGNPINVHRCDPKEGSVTYSGYAAYSPGYYPPGRAYYWNDPYRHRYYQAPVTATQSSGRLYLDYTNTSDRVIKEIEFGLVARAHVIAEIRDVGTFSPGIEIKKEFGLDRNVFPIGTGLPQCVPLRLTWADGTTWLNPHLPAVQSSLYRSPH
ncbi:MAG: hypothetical protein ABI282_03550 [Candidatus Baltobacteraceae bacterium]